MIIVKYFVSYLLTAVIFFALDIVWLGFVAKNIYGKYLGHLLKSQFNWGAGSYYGGARLGDHDTVSGLAGKEVSEKRRRCHRSLKMECPVNFL